MLDRYGAWIPLVWLLALLIAPVIDSLHVDHRALAWMDLVVLAVAYVLAVRHGRTGRRPSWLADVALAVGMGAAVALVFTGTQSAAAAFALVAIGIGACAHRVVVAPALLAVTVAAIVSFIAIGVSAGQAWWQAGFTTFLAGASTYAFVRLFETIAQLRATRTDLARAAVAEERERFSRDLHDLLGHTLSVVVVKAETVRRLAEQNPAVAARQAADIEALGRQALREVRDAVEGYRTRGVASEVESARDALAAAGVDCEVAPMPTAPLPERTDRLLAWVVREACTNVVRHADARHCRIEVTGPNPVRLTVTDDGAGPATPARTPGEAVVDPFGRAGHGLHGLDERVRAAGGRLTVGGGPSGFVLTAEIPAADPAAAAPDPVSAGSART